MKKKVTLIFAVLVTLLSGCNTSQPYNAMWDYDYSEMDFIQLEEPYEGQPMCVIDTTLGTLKAVLYPDLAPNTVDNFIARVNDGYYDNKLIYGVWEDAYFMTGALDETFQNGVTSDGKPIPAEYSVDLWPFKGAMIGFYNTVGYSDSRFLIANDYRFSDEEIEKIRSFINSEGEQQFPEELVNAMIDNEGYWVASGYFSIFGQTIDGFEVIDKIMSVDVDGETFSPVEDIYINSITLTTYTND